MLDSQSLFSPPSQRLRHTPPPHDFQPPYFPPPYPHAIHPLQSQGIDFQTAQQHYQPHHPHLSTPQIMPHQDPYSLHFYNNNNNYTQQSLVDNTYNTNNDRNNYNNYEMNRRNSDYPQHHHHHHHHRNSNNTIQLLQQQHTLDLSSRDPSSLFGLAGAGVGGGVMHSINGLGLDEDLIMQVCAIFRKL